MVGLNGVVTWCMEMCEQRAFQCCQVLATST